MITLSSTCSARSMFAVVSHAAPLDNIEIFYDQDKKKAE